jgi:CubicO group peptidase (beta-lactamase class C family)
MATTRDEATLDKDARTRPVREDALHRAPVRFGGPELRAWMDGILNRHPAVGLAVGIVRDGSLELFDGRGFADIGSKRLVDADTVFRIGSVTKPFTAVAVMQLHEQGLIDLDAPAADYLRGYELISARQGFGPATVRHLLTHTAGIAEVQRVRDLLHPEAGPFGGRPPILSVSAGEPMPSLAEYYRRGLPVVVEPGTRFAYSNPGYDTLARSSRT